MTHYNILHQTVVYVCHRILNTSQVGWRYSAARLCVDAPRQAPTQPPVTFGAQGHTCTQRGLLPLKATLAMRSPLPRSSVTVLRCTIKAMAREDGARAGQDAAAADGRSSTDSSSGAVPGRCFPACVQSAHGAAPDGGCSRSAALLLPRNPREAPAQAGMLLPRSLSADKEPINNARGLCPFCQLRYCAPLHLSAGI